MNEPTQDEIQELQSLISTASEYGDSSTDWNAKRLMACIEAGKKFADIKRRLGHGHWEKWAESVKIAVSKHTRCRWMTLAKLHADGKILVSDAGSIRKAYRLAGIIPDSDGSKAKSVDHQADYILHATRFIAALNRLDFAKLSDDQREILAARFVMIANIARRLQE